MPPERCSPASPRRGVRLRLPIPSGVTHRNSQLRPKLAMMNTPRMIFRLAYLLGLKPWDTGVTPPELVDWVEGPKALPPGNALDIGCGTGTNCQYLLAHKGQVTGVDFVPGARKAAKRTAPGAA